jgi:Zn-dependent protease
VSSLNLAHLAVWYLVFVFSTTCHEFAHALGAHRGGDRTASERGLMSLDPIPHIVRTPLGMLIVPVVSYLTKGWMLGWASVPYDPEWGKSHPRRQALMSLAGPCANLVLAATALGFIRLLLSTHVFVLPQSLTIEHLVVARGDPAGRSLLSAGAMALSIMATLNVLLGVFNLLPVPPLDGAGIVEGLCPQPVSGWYERWREDPTLRLLGLAGAWYASANVCFPVLGFVLRVALG